MQSIDPEEPIFELHVNGKQVATLCTPRWEDMFWCSYRIKPLDADAERIVRDTKIWETVSFIIKDSQGGIPNQHTFSGGYTDFCDGRTDRLTFRSLWPPQPTKIKNRLTWLTQQFARFVYCPFRSPQKQEEKVK
jgi:hypothetical protein